MPSLQHSKGQSRHRKEKHSSPRRSTRIEKLHGKRPPLFQPVGLDTMLPSQQCNQNCSELETHQITAMNAIEQTFALPELLVHIFLIDQVLDVLDLLRSKAVNHSWHNALNTSSLKERMHLAPSRKRDPTEARVCEIAPSSFVNFSVTDEPLWCDRSYPPNSLFLHATVDVDALRSSIGSWKDFLLVQPAYTIMLQTVERFESRRNSCIKEYLYDGESCGATTLGNIAEIVRHATDGENQGIISRKPYLPLAKVWAHLVPDSTSCVIPERRRFDINGFYCGGSALSAYNFDSAPVRESSFSNGPPAGRPIS